MVKINGEELNLSGKSISDYIAQVGFGNSPIAVELNGYIVPKDKYAETILKDGDTVEVVRFVGGG